MGEAHVWVGLGGGDRGQLGRGVGGVGGEEGLPSVDLVADSAALHALKALPA